MQNKNVVRRAFSISLIRHWVVRRTFSAAVATTAVDVPARYYIPNRLVSRLKPKLISGLLSLLHVAQAVGALASVTLQHFSPENGDFAGRLNG